MMRDSEAAARHIRRRSMLAHVCMRRLLLLRQPIDREDPYELLAFVYGYLSAHKRAPTDAAIREVMRALARYRGPRIATFRLLERHLLRQETPAGSASV